MNRPIVAMEFSKRPALLREQLLAKGAGALKFPIILDEVQKVPQILDEVHWLIENNGLAFGNDLNVYNRA